MWLDLNTTSGSVHCGCPHKPDCLKNLDFATENVLYQSMVAKCALFQFHMTFQIYQKKNSYSFILLIQTLVMQQFMVLSCLNSYTNTQSKEAFVYSLPWTFYFSAAVTLHLAAYAYCWAEYFYMKYHLGHRCRLTWHVYKSTVKWTVYSPKKKRCTMYSRVQWTRTEIQHELSIGFFFNSTNPMVHIASTMYSFCTKHCPPSCGIFSWSLQEQLSAIQKIQLILWSEEIIVKSWNPTISCKPVIFTFVLMITQAITTSA